MSDHSDDFQDPSPEYVEDVGYGSRINDQAQDGVHMEHGNTEITGCESVDEDNAANSDSLDFDLLDSDFELDDMVRYTAQVQENEMDDVGNSIQLLPQPLTLNPPRTDERMFTDNMPFFGDLEGRLERQIRQLRQIRQKRQIRETPFPSLPSMPSDICKCPSDICKCPSDICPQQLHHLNSLHSFPCLTQLDYPPPCRSMQPPYMPIYQIHKHIYPSLDPASIYSYPLPLAYYSDGSIHHESIASQLYQSADTSGYQMDGWSDLIPSTDSIYMKKCAAEEIYVPVPILNLGADNDKTVGDTWPSFLSVSNDFMSPKATYVPYLCPGPDSLSAYLSNSPTLYTVNDNEIKGSREAQQGDKNTRPGFIRRISAKLKHMKGKPKKESTGDREKQAYAKDFELQLNRLPEEQQIVGNNLISHKRMKKQAIEDDFADGRTVKQGAFSKLLGKLKRKRGKPQNDGSGHQGTNNQFGAEPIPRKHVGEVMFGNCEKSQHQRTEGSKQHDVAVWVLSRTNEVGPHISAVTEKEVTVWGQAVDNAVKHGIPTELQTCGMQRKESTGDRETQADAENSKQQVPLPRDEHQQVFSDRVETGNIAEEDCEEKTVKCCAISKLFRKRKHRRRKPQQAKTSDREHSTESEKLTRQVNELSEQHVVHAELLLEHKRQLLENARRTESLRSALHNLTSDDDLQQTSASIEGNTQAADSLWLQRERNPHLARQQDAGESSGLTALSQTQPAVQSALSQSYQASLPGVSGYEPRSILRRQDSRSPKKSVTFSEGTNSPTTQATADTKPSTDAAPPKTGKDAKETPGVTSCCSSGYYTDGTSLPASRHASHNINGPCGKEVEEKPLSQEPIGNGADSTTDSRTVHQKNEDGQQLVQSLSQIYRSRESGIGVSIRTVEASMRNLSTYEGVSASSSIQELNTPDLGQTETDQTHRSGHSGVPVVTSRARLQDTMNVTLPIPAPRKSLTSHSQELSRPVPAPRGVLRLIQSTKRLRRPVPTPRFLKNPQVHLEHRRPTPLPRTLPNSSLVTQELKRPVPTPREACSVSTPRWQLHKVPSTQDVSKEMAREVPSRPRPAQRTIKSLALKQSQEPRESVSPWSVIEMTSIVLSYLMVTAQSLQRSLVDVAEYDCHISEASEGDRGPMLSEDVQPRVHGEIGTLITYEYPYGSLEMTYKWSANQQDKNTIPDNKQLLKERTGLLAESDAPKAEGQMDKLKRILNPNYLLEDGDINPALDQMSKQWPHVLSQTVLYSPCPERFQRAGDRDYVQVVHDADHWRAFTNIGGEIRYFDSMGLALSDNVLRAISVIAGLEIAGVSLLEVKSRVKLEKVQKQKGGTDCGLFAIAHLVEVLCKGDPTAVTFKQGRIMREHYYDCLVKHNWLPFPRVKPALPKTEARKNSDVATEEVLKQSAVVIQSEGGQLSSTPLEMPVSEVVSQEVSPVVSQIEGQVEGQAVSQAVSQVAKVKGKSVSLDSDLKSPPKQAHEKRNEERQSASTVLPGLVCQDPVSRDPSDSPDKSQSHVDLPTRENTTCNQPGVLPVLYLRPLHKAPHTSKESISKELISSELDDHDESALAASNLPHLTSQLPRLINATRTKQPKRKRKRYRKGMSLVDRLIKSFERLEEEIKREETDNWVTEQQHYLSIGRRHYITDEEMSIAEQASVFSNGNEINRYMSVLDNQSGEVVQSVDLSRTISNTNSISTFPGVRSAQDDHTQEECHTALDGITHDSSNDDSGSTLTRIISAQDDQSTVLSSEDHSRTVSSNSTRSEVISAQENQSSASSAESSEDDSESILNGTNSRSTGVTLSQLDSAQDDQTSAMLSDNEAETIYSNSSGVTLSQLPSAQDDQSSVVSSEDSSERIDNLSSRGSGDTLSQLNSAQDDQSSSRSGYDGSSTMSSSGSGITQEGAISVQGDQLPIPENDWSVSGDSDDSGSTLSRAPGSDQDDWLPHEEDDMS